MRTGIERRCGAMLSGCCRRWSCSLADVGCLSGADDSNVEVDAQDGRPAGSAPGSLSRRKWKDLPGICAALRRVQISEKVLDPEERSAAAPFIPPAKCIMYTSTKGPRADLAEIYRSMTVCVNLEAEASVASSTVLFCEE